MLDFMTAASVGVSLEKYLETAYEHDPDYVDGELVERSMPTLLHSETAERVQSCLRGLKSGYPLHLRPELRMPVASRRFEWLTSRYLLASGRKVSFEAALDRCRNSVGRGPLVGCTRQV